jgi:alanine racemase
VLRKLLGGGHRHAHHAIDRWAWADIDLDALTHNVQLLKRSIGDAELWVVVKANGYGHGDVPCAMTALNAGATGLLVALAEEAVTLRHAGIDVPILVLSEQPRSDWQTMIDHGLIFTVYNIETARELVKLVTPKKPVHAHVKIDTGMNRVGVDPAYATEVIDTLIAGGVIVDGVYTHLACADEPSRPENSRQLDAFDSFLSALNARGVNPTRVHAANSAAALLIPRSRFSFVRVGIAMYGIQPSAHTDLNLKPVLSLRARVSHVHQVRAGEPVSYGARWNAPADTIIATVPIGYADGVARRLSFTGGEVLIGGRRLPIRGAITMDQLMVEVDESVKIGDEVVIIGTQGSESISAEEIAAKIDTIPYEVVCDVSVRIERKYHSAN